MNNVLQLKGSFKQERNKAGGGGKNLPKGALVKVSEINDYINELNNERKYWENKDIIKGALISVRYNKVAAKSNRVSGLLCKKYENTSDYIVGARFYDQGENKKHIITYHIDLETIDESLRRLNLAKEIVINYFQGEVNESKISKIDSFKINFKELNITKTMLINTLVDCYYVEKFFTIDNVQEIKENGIISLFEVGEKVEKILSSIGIELNQSRIINSNTVFLSSEDINKINEKAPYLISMAVEDLSKIIEEDFSSSDNSQMLSIPSPKNEPIIGVIDTLFNEDVYFSEWVEYENFVNKNIPTGPNDYKHGTAVSSIIVDGPTLNKNIDDGCGRFRVKHFGVATSGAFSSFTIIRNIQKIIKLNPNIKVWNLSLGSIEEVNDNFISIEASILDQIQYENDVIFVIAGTNKISSRPDIKRIGAPADSINSVVVNAVNKENNPTNYSREGIILSFFTKPDFSYFGGEGQHPIRVNIEKNKEHFMRGTSFSAPWITRKLAYLIEVLGLTREIAKAMLIDSSTDWTDQKDSIDFALIGNGVVPTHINNIIKTKPEEIRFVIQGVSKNYHSYTYNIPIPTDASGHPYVAKISLCYFPKCSRNQGVDYTNTELDLYFGRITEKGTIKSINNNKQSNESISYLKEKFARKLFRKWDNSKHFKEVFTNKTRHRTVYNTSKLWGIAIKRKERLTKLNPDENINFGIVVTLKEIKGKNRIEEFIRMCELRGWIVNELNIENKINIYNKIHEEITFD